ncbi:class I SAM-dependent methyltransferase [Enterobacter sp. DTU_2021_1002640_1_SI_PRY_ASU_LCPMC_013]|uniref:class I SAM-dependent methyltransferase n=1 Tax=Enterobacter sp. DTU_2021_1002640_1_SI_PRY_ASU_LCPMC_013 TaxID=3077940 RepID=UPI0028F0F94C|nr:class I SAM-dependent methyltransferase [Enterobacter sp. DTU_2021_1002640_1_SI_PRY_ASU_LCPMC_013]WNU99116.1 class I SAM-dependent methyltransferase [Enterobacter sp. DTU_2021_1002640_1_SI_PRY_ASU_LCPMC_013]
METYEQIYQELRNNDKPAWTGDGYPRAWAKLTETLDSLAATDHLPETGSHILELGCGNGMMASLWFARKGYHVCGVDFSPTAIDWARENFARQGISGVFLHDNVCSLVQLGENRFDLIFDGSCMHCLTGNLRGQAYRAVRRLLRENGTFIISSMCGEPGYEEDRQQYDAIRHILYRKGMPWRALMPLISLQNEIISAGFSIQHVKLTRNPWWDHATLAVTPCYTSGLSQL